MERFQGSSLQRFLIPFVSKVKHHERKQHRLEIIELLMLLNRNRSTLGLEVVSLDPMNIEIEWPYEALFHG